MQSKTKVKTQMPNNKNAYKLQHNNRHRFGARADMFHIFGHDFESIPKITN